MFSPATKKLGFSARKERNSGHTIHDSPVTPFSENRRSLKESSIPNRPSSGTPAPWVSRPSVLARIPPAKKNEKEDDVDQIKPVYVGDYPQVVRDEQASFLQKNGPGDVSIFGGMDKEMSLSWIICGDKLFIWSYLSPITSKTCITLNIPVNVSQNGGSGNDNFDRDNKWLLSVVCFNSTTTNSNKASKQSNSVSIVLCNKKSRAIVYWPDIYSQEWITAPIISLTASNESIVFNSLITSSSPGSLYNCIAIACCSNGDLWQFDCSSKRIHRSKLYQNIVGQLAKSTCYYPKSLIWRRDSLNDESYRQFFLLTNHEIHCFNLKISPPINVSKLWSEMIVSDDDSDQKKVLPLDIQTDGHGNKITILIATFCEDLVSSSSYIQYSFLTMQFKSDFNKQSHENVLEKPASIQIIIPKARMEEEESLFSMRLRVGGKPNGSAIILAGDGTATVYCCYGNSTRLYQFNLPYDVGKVLDASAFPSSENEEEGDGSWVVLTEKAGLWAIPEKAIEPLEQSSSRKGRSNDRFIPEEIRHISQRTALLQDDESEALLGQIFHEFMITGKVDGSLEKLDNARAFERDGETNIFARTSKSIVDSLAKHWTTTRGAEIVSMSAMSTQLMDKQQKHTKFLQFLALSKCHEVLCSRQRVSLQIIMEHGEKLAGMIQLRELQNMINQNRSESEISGSLWDLIQLVGEQTRRTTVLLMDRDNSEVFYSKISTIEEVFRCIDRELEYLISTASPLMIQIQKAFELSNACVTIISTAMQYRNEHHVWYPPPEKLKPWYCQRVVRDGFWRITSFLLQYLKEHSEIEMSMKSELYSHLEVVAEILLDAFNGAVRAKIEYGEDLKSLLEEFQNRKDELLGSLYQQVKDLAEAKCQNLNEGIEASNGEILRKLSSRLLSIAKQHEGYETLWNICRDLNDSTLLSNLMHSSTGSRSGFSYFVFKKLYETKQFAKLLRLGEEFQEELSTFIKLHKDLLWLHQAYLHQFSSASETLHSLAVFQDDNEISSMEEESTAPADPVLEPTLADRKRFLYLSKIAAMAGKDSNYEAKVKRIEADLKLLKLQEEITQMIFDHNENTRQNKVRLLSPEDLIKLCLKDENPELSLQAFEVFAWTDTSFRNHNKALLEQCWKNAADQDDWARLHQTSIAEGLTEEDTLHALRQTILFQASSRCYGPETETYDGGFDQVLQLRQDNFDDLSLNDSSGFSVEGILMKHKDYTDAGKLMLTAIMLGSVQTDFVDDDGGPELMD